MNYGSSSVSVVRLDAMRGLSRKGVAVRSTSETALVIEAPEALAMIEALPARPSVVMTRFAMLDRQLLDRVRPDRVVFPLIARHFDAVEVLELLRALSWKGIVTVIGPQLSAPKVVEAELRSTLPDAAVSLV